MRSIAALAVFLLLVSACSSEPAIPDWALATAVPTADTATDTSAPGSSPGEIVDGGAVVLGSPASVPGPSGPPGTAIPSAEPATASQVRTVSFATGEEVRFTTRPGDLSWMVSVSAAQAGDTVAITRVRAPGGETRYLADPEHDVLLVDDLHTEVLLDTDALGLYVSGSQAAPLPSGEWTVDVVGSVSQPQSQVAITSGDASAPQRLDVAVWSTTAVDDFDAFQNGWRIAMSEVLAPHSIGIGRLDLMLAGEAGTPFTTLTADDQALLRQACRAAREATDPPPGTALVILVDQVSGSAEMRTGMTAATPGTAVLGPASHACVAVSRGEVAAEQGVAALHQILRQTGLAQYTTSPDGLTFDGFDDTAECRLRNADSNADLLVSPEECADDGGADNIMFWSGTGQALTAEQAWQVRSHPLLHS